ncbi:MAG: site-2 protease family protein, partial [Clostridia bacterium]|nr:site-2 protease family protein [Clostridia bacterium]
MSGVLKLFSDGQFIEALLFIIAAVFSIMLHELAHGYAAVKNGDLTPRIANRLNFNPLNHFDPIGFGMFLFIGFGWAKPVPINPNNFNNYRKGLFQVSIAGVALNYLIAFVSFPLFSVFSSQLFSTGSIVFYYLFWFFSIMFSLNLILCVFNLLPV